jgi:hypothetical protein
MMARRRPEIGEEIGEEREDGHHGGERERESRPLAWRRLRRRCRSR